MTPTPTPTPAATMSRRLGEDSYLTLVPRGLHHVVLECMENIMKPHYTLRTCLMGEEDQNDKQQSLKRIVTLLHLANQKKRSNVEGACVNGAPVGTACDVVATGRHVSVGYVRSSSTSSPHVVTSYPGQLEGVVWIHFTTNAPTDVVGNCLRCIGPLVALVHVFHDIDLNENQSLEEATGEIQRALPTDYSMDVALQTWHSHVMTTWSLDNTQRTHMTDIVNGNTPIKFRLSCIRNQSKRYKYTREQLLRSVADNVVPQNKWVVDLTRYHVEVVLMVRPTCLAIGLSLRPYQQLGAKGFSSGTVPPDLAAPYLSGNVLSGLVRLRPSTAHVLLYLAKVQPGDVVLDPCAGIGTIPMEVPYLNRHAFGLGGDVVLSPQGLGSVASNYIKQAKDTLPNKCPADLISWDAIKLPLRRGSVDVVVSDLPFGQQCLSSSKLDSFLPLLLAEVARVLTPSSGRMVLLCGSYAPILETLLHLNELAGNNDDGRDTHVWTLPCTAVFPVNVGGLLAWIIKVQRGPGKPVQLHNHFQRVKKATNNRERIAKQRARQEQDHKGGGRSKYRRIQS